MDLIVKLKQANDIKNCGGKAINLAKMLQAGLRVPDGFVITTSVYREHNPYFPKGLVTQIEKMFDELGAARVAVRSSAVAEDSANASWAGQLETVLNVSKGGLIKAIEYCWSSMQSERAQVYATEHKVNKSQQSIAVIVQAMVDSEKSGVMFTANPITSNTDEIVIEAVYGLGELLVQGLETPENLVIHKDSRHVLDHNTHQQKQKMIYEASQNTIIELDDDLKDKPILTKNECNQLAELAAKVENYYKAPQDVEWAISNGQVWLVQSRPITTL